MLQVAPALALRPFISHYWLSRDNRANEHRILPDGAVDLVLLGSRREATLFGSVSRCSLLPVLPGEHYLGVRFRPGQSRHFIHPAAGELTDSSISAHGLLRFDLQPLQQRPLLEGAFELIDELLLAHLQRVPPERDRIDAVIEWLQRHPRDADLEQAAALFGRGRRQLERVLGETLGLSARRYAAVLRLQQASALLCQSQQPLAEVALAAGYCDQSHMNHDFRRLADITPRQLRRMSR